MTTESILTVGALLLFLAINSGIFAVWKFNKARNDVVAIQTAEKVTLKNQVALNTGLLSELSDKQMDDAMADLKTEHEIQNQNRDIEKLEMRVGELCELSKIMEKRIAAIETEFTNNTLSHDELSKNMEAGFVKIMSAMRKS